FFRHVDYRNAGHHSGTVKKNIDLAVLGERLFHHFGDALFATGIDLHSDGVSLGVADLRGSFFRHVLGVVRNNYLVSARRQTAADIRPDPPGPTGDDNYLIHDYFLILRSFFWRRYHQ